jgi:hypothetical protein
MPNDTKIQDIALNYIRKHVEGGKSKCPSTTIALLHPSLVGRLSLDAGELVLLSAFFSEESWYAFTTRRIVSQFRGVLRTVDPSGGIQSDFGNFKGYDFSKEWDEDNPPDVTAIPKEVATIMALDSIEVVQFEFETWEASMLPIYAARYWNIKHPFLGKLMTAAERENYKTRND